MGAQPDAGVGPAGAVEEHQHTRRGGEAGRQRDNNTLHEYVFISQTREGMRLDHQNCQDTIARPLCQYLES